MCSARVQLEIAPAVTDVVAGRLGAVEPEQHQALFHDLLRLEVYVELCVLVRHTRRRVR